MTEKLATELENDILDSHYVIVGALEGALASGDKNVRRLWRRKIGLCCQIPALSVT